MSESMGFSPRCPIASPHPRRSRHPTAPAVLPILPPASCPPSRSRAASTRSADLPIPPATPALPPSHVRAPAHSHPLCITFYPVPHLSPTSTCAEGSPPTSVLTPPPRPSESQPPERGQQGAIRATVAPARKEFLFLTRRPLSSLRTATGHAGRAGSVSMVFRVRCRLVTC